MIRGLATKADGRHVLLLGLGPENLRRLVDDQPIVVNLHSIDSAGTDVAGQVDEVLIFDASDPAALRTLLSAANPTPTPPPTGK